MSGGILLTFFKIIFRKNMHIIIILKIFKYEKIDHSVIYLIMYLFVQF